MVCWTLAWRIPSLSPLTLPPPSFSLRTISEIVIFSHPSSPSFRFHFVQHAAGTYIKTTPYCHPHSAMPLPTLSSSFSLSLSPASTRTRTRVHYSIRPYIHKILYYCVRHLNLGFRMCFILSFSLHFVVSSASFPHTVIHVFYLCIATVSYNADFDYFWISTV